MTPSKAVALALVIVWALVVALWDVSDATTAAKVTRFALGVAIGVMASLMCFGVSA